MEEESEYAKAGVDFNLEHAVVEIFKEMSLRSRRFTQDLVKIGIKPLDDTGLFANGALIDFRKLVENGYTKGALLYGTDGAGTKPLVHQILNSDDRNPIQKFELLSLNEYESALSVGIDAVAMVSNDLVCSGARPLHLSDYVAWKIPDTRVANDLANGLLRGAELSKATIVGGENASLKEMITGAGTNPYDICAFGTGIILNPKYIEKPLNGSQIQEGDLIMGLRSSGLHCNGISLARKTLIDSPELGWDGKYDPNEVVKEFGKTPVQEILTPTTIYVNPILQLIESSIDVHGIVNITGEGIANLGRLLERTESLGAELDFKTVERPHPVFKEIQDAKEVSTQEMYNDFNMGWGMYVIVTEADAYRVVHKLRKIYNNQERLNPQNIGYITKQKDHEITGVACDRTKLNF